MGEGTRVLTVNPVTSGPISCTTPAMSSPMFIGRLAGGTQWTLWSLGLSPQAMTFIRSSPGPGTGMGTVWMDTLREEETRASFILVCWCDMLFYDVTAMEGFWSKKQASVQDIKMIFTTHKVKVELCTA